MSFRKRPLLWAVLTRLGVAVPSVRRIVYSTCSVHAIENEHVVREAIKSEEATSGGFRLGRKKEVLPTWERRGIPEEMDDPGMHTQNARLAYI